jgi:hypothetical protein
MSSRLGLGHNHMMFSPRRWKRHIIEGSTLTQADFPIQDNVCISFVRDLPITTENIKQEVNLVIDGGQSDGDNLNPLHPQATSPSIAPDHSAPQGANHPDHLSAIPASGVDNLFCMSSMVVNPLPHQQQQLNCEIPATIIMYRKYH